MWQDNAYLLDMLIAARKLRDYALNASFEQLQSNELIQLGITHLVQIIGEAARKISLEYKSSHPEIPWKGLINLRHRLVHEYFRIEIEEVWDVITQEIPELIPLLEPLVSGPGE